MEKFIVDRRRFFDGALADESESRSAVSNSQRSHLSFGSTLTAWRFRAPPLGRLVAPLAGSPR